MRVSREQVIREYQPLLPLEKKFIAGSLLLGIVLLGLLMWISHIFFPGGRRAAPVRRTSFLVGGLRTNEFWLDGAWFG